MVRPIYETEADRKRESSAIEAFAKRYEGLTIEAMPRHHRADYKASKGDMVVAYIEVKTRTCSSKQYFTYHISKSKLDSLVRLAEGTNAIPVLLVQWTDRSGWIGVKNYLESATFKKGGRWDRGDALDVETMAEAPINLFKFL